MTSASNEFFNTELDILWAKEMNACFQWLCKDVSGKVRSYSGPEVKIGEWG